MRIAVSGTHGSGKTTLIGDFVDANPEFVVVDEPYESLDESSQGADAWSFLHQLELSLRSVTASTGAPHVIFDRSPVDFIAYVSALSALGRPSPSPVGLVPWNSRAASALEHIDLRVVLPLDGHVTFHVEDEEDDALREEMNRQLLDLVYDVARKTEVVEIAGPREDRCAALVAAYQRTMSE